MKRTQSHSFTNNDFTFYPTVEYFSLLRRKIARTVAGDRVQLTTMDFNPEEAPILAVISELRKAARRGVVVSLGIDARNFLYTKAHGLGPLFYHGKLGDELPKNIRNRYEVLQAVREAGGTVGIINQPTRRFSNPAAGRSHIKTSIINNQIFIGGCNLEDAKHLDLMVTWTDTKTADWLYAQMDTMITQQSSRALGEADQLFVVDDQTELLLDVGVKSQSLIYERALEIIDKAEHWLVITCQFFPNSRTAKHLKRAHQRGVKVYPIFNHSSQHVQPHSFVQRMRHDNLLQRAVIDRERLRMPKNFFEGKLPRNVSYLHAKLIATEKEAIIGSHNYVKAGVNFGTAEIALHREDPLFAQAATQTMLEELGFASDTRFDFVNPK